MRVDFWIGFASLPRRYGASEFRNLYASFKIVEGCSLVSKPLVDLLELVRMLSLVIEGDKHPIHFDLIGCFSSLSLSHRHVLIHHSRPIIELLVFLEGQILLLHQFLELDNRIIDLIHVLLFSPIVRDFEVRYLHSVWWIILDFSLCQRVPMLRGIPLLHWRVGVVLRVNWLIQRRIFILVDCLLLEGIVLLMLSVAVGLWWPRQRWWFPCPRNFDLGCRHDGV